ncbi:hypothetical protein GF402_09115 [Candidatus Fermentibacteria bacterium]|nr:hypothetical protein [Candidatus Fermentibacteria bacterium]
MRTIRWIVCLGLGLVVSGAVAGPVIDHTCTDLESIPNQWIESVQDSVQSHYAHTSHGSQLTWGLSFLEDDDPFYDYEIADCYLPEVVGAWCIFNGQETETYITPDLYWESHYGMNLTRDVLDHNPELDTSMWCWCCQCDYYSEQQVRAYLDSMTVLESEYPDVTFVYFTGNAQGTGESGYNRWQRNQQIRDYCADNNKWLFDFADLDCWWYNPSTSQWEQHTYEYQGEDIPAEHPEFYGDEYGHTTEGSCRQKGRALWYMMALIAGWQGTGLVEQQEHSGYSLEVVSGNPSLGYLRLGYTVPEPSRVSISVYGSDGRLRNVPVDGMSEPGRYEISVGHLDPGVYACVLSTDVIQLYRKVLIIE